MKYILALIASFGILTAQAAEPAKAPEQPKHEMKLAKKKDHSKDKKVDATKSPKSDKKAPAKKADSK